MKSPHKEKFISAMVKEINEYTTQKHWKYCLNSTVPPSLILRYTWTFRIKRNRPTGDIMKFKARFCADGRSEELGINYN